MTDLIDDGWLWLNNGTDYLKLACSQISWTPHLGTSFTHYPGGNFSVDMGMVYFTFKAKGIQCSTTTKYETIIENLLDWQSSGTFTLEIIKDSSDNKIKPDGTNTSYTVRLQKNGIKKGEKVEFGDGEHCEIKMLSFEEG